MIRSVTQLCNDRAITSWEQHLRAIGRSEGTIEQYSSYVVRFLRGRSAYAATLDDVEEWMAAHRWAPATRRSAASSLASFYRWALRQGHIPADPTADLERAKSTRPCPKPTPDNIVAHALAATHGPNHWLLLAALTTGLRRSEVARLHSDQVELHSDGYWLRIAGKGDVVRLVPCPDDLADWLMDCHGWAFPSRKYPGRHQLPASVGKRLKRILSGYSAHTLRHHYATEAYQESGDLLATQLLLGHRSPVTTIGYVQQDPARLRKAAAATWVA